MLKTIKKIILSCLSILGISFIFWTIFLLNPNLSYANKTHFDHVTVFHNQDLDEQTETVIKDAIKLIKTSEIFDEDLIIQLCLNDDKIYPDLHPLAGQPLAYAFFDKTIIKNCKTNFDKNVVEAKWAINNYEFRTFDLTYLLAHEFTHNLQSNYTPNYYIKTTIGKLNWKLEGHAEYIARAFKNDGKLAAKIEFYLIEETKKHSGIPVFEIENGTKQSLSYYKYALVTQYLMEEKELTFQQICDLETNFDTLFEEMVEWSKK